jgi:anaerobic selenocysteine-containing dehydrogenase
MTHKISRRRFIAGGAAVAASGVLAGCQPGVRRWVILEPFVRPPEQQLDGNPTWYASTCRQCPAGCGIVVRLINGRALKIEGNPQHPLNQGKLCPQGQAGLQLLYNPDRLSKPLQTAKRGSGDFAQIPWDSAVGLLTQKLRDAGGAVAVLGSPAMSGHLYALFGTLTKAIGAPDPLVWDLRSAWNAQAELASSTKQIYGADTLPSYNLSNADLVLSFGADFVGNWLSMTRYGTEFGNFRGQPKGLRGQLVQFEPHMSLTAAKADMWVPIHPGTDGLVAQAIARIIADQKLGSAEISGRAAAAAGNVDVNAAAATAGVAVETLVRAARALAEAAHPVAIPGNGLSGPGEVAAVESLNTIAGSTGVILSAPPPMPDIKQPVASPYSTIQELIDHMRSGAVKVLLIYGANPVYDLPDKAGFRDALDKVGYVVDFNTILDETAANAHLVLPDRSYLESWGYTAATPNWGTPVVSGQQPVVTPINDAQATGDVLITVGKQIPAAASAFPWPDEVAYLKEVIGKLPPGAHGGSGNDVQWARWQQYGGWWPAAQPAAAPAQATASGPVSVTPPEFQGDQTQYPFYLYLFMTPLLGAGGGANIPWLQGSPDPLTTVSWQTWAAIHPDTMQKLGVNRGDVVRVSTPDGDVEAPAYPYPGIRADTIAIPFGQGHTAYGRYANGKGSNPVRLLSAQAGPGGNSPAWSGLRCQVTRTGTTDILPTFEQWIGIEPGFINQSLPGG